ncbi:MAG: hypothetical protein ACQ9MH_15940 [Nitrospinales bacterium]
MHVIVADDSLKEAWEQYVENRPTIAWQSWEWFNVVRKHYSVKFYPLVAVSDSEICGVLPLYRVKTISGRNKLISVPYAVAGGIVADSEDAESLLLAKAIELYKSLDCGNIIFKQYKHKVRGDLRVDDNFYNRELDLTQIISSLWDNLAEENKTNIELARNYSLNLEYPSADLSRFYELLLLHHRNSGIPCVSKKWIRDLIRFKMYSIALLKMGDKIVAGTMVKEHKKTVSFPFTCIPDSSDESTMFAYQLYWQLIEKFVESGKEIFHSGRIPKTNQTYAYRLGWGGKMYDYYYQYFPNDTSKVEYSNKRGRKREILSAVWRKLPIWLTKILGPHVVKQFP